MSSPELKLGPAWLNGVLERPMRAEARWLARGRTLPAGLSLLAVLLLLGLVGLRLWWGRVAAERLRRAQAPVVAAGDPVNGQQMNPPPLAPETAG